MNITRRNALALSASAAALALTGSLPRPAQASPEDAANKITELAGGATPQKGRVTLTAPEIAENGNTVPIGVSVESEMTEGDLVQSVSVFAEENPSPEVVTFYFTPLSGKAEANTRMRLAKTQNVVAVAKMADGSVYFDKKQVKVTIGGCGG